MVVRVVCGLPADDRAARLFDETLAAQPAGGRVHVVRTQARAAQLVETALARGMVLAGTVATTLRDLVGMLASARRTPRRILDDAERRLLLEHLVAHAPPSALLKVPGVAGWLGALFSRLKQADVFSAARARAEFPSLRRQVAAADAALALFDVYQQHLVAHRLYDADGLFLEVARDLDGTSTEIPLDRLLPRRDTLIVEGFYQTTPIERAVFARLAAVYRETIWLLDRPADQPAGTPGLAVFDDLTVGAAAAVSAGDLTWLLRDVHGELMNARGAPVDLSAHGSSSRPMDLAWATGAAVTAPIVWRPADDLAEARAFAARAARLRTDDPAAAIVVAFPSDAAAAPLLEEAFADAGVPLATNVRKSLLETGVARGLFAILRLRAAGFTRTSVVAAVRAADSGFEIDPTLPANAGDNRLRSTLLDQVSRAAGIVGGELDWSRKLAAHAAACEGDVADATDDADRAHAERRRAAAQLAVRGVAALLAMVPASGAMLANADFVQLARQLVNRCDLLRPRPLGRGALRGSDVRAQALASRAATGVARLLDAYLRVGPVLGTGPRAFESHVDALEALARGVSVSAGPPPAGAVRLLGIRDIPGLDIDHLLVGGLTEGAFPVPVEPPPLLDDADATRAGARSTVALAREADHLLLHLLLAPRKSLVLAAPRRVAEREALLASAAEIGVPPLADPFAPDGAEAGSPAVAGAFTPTAARRLALELERLSTTTVSRTDGMLEAAAWPLVLARFHPVDDVWSATRFDEFVACPLMFFNRRILRVAVAAEAEREITPLERGDMLHRTLFRYEQARRAEPAADGARRRALMLDIAADEHARHRRDDLYAEVAASRLMGGLKGEGRPGVLAAYLDYEAKRPPASRPKWLEARFGSGADASKPGTVLSESPVTLACGGGADGVASAPVVALKLQGAIDRVDVGVVGGADGAFVIDYKGGAVEHLGRDVRAGAKFQLLLYAAALDALGDAHVVGGGYYTLKSAAKMGLKAAFADEAVAAVFLPPRGARRLAPGAFQTLVSAALVRAGAVANAVARGAFHPTAVEDVPAHCDRCDYAPGCRSRGDANRFAALPASAGLFPQRVSLLGTADGHDDVDGGDGDEEGDA